MDQKSTSTTKDTAIVTGASSGIGLEIANMLAELGYEVVGIARHFEECVNYPFKTEVCDITDTYKLLSIVSSKQNIKMLVNCAGIGSYGLSENISCERLKEMTRTNLEAPMILTGHVLPLFKRQGEGTIVFISSVTAFKPNTYGAAYGALKAGLSSFASSVFEESRKHGIKVIEICPDMTRTNLYRDADFTTDDDPMAYLRPEDVAQTLKSAITAPGNACVTRITIVPQLNRIKRR